MSGPRRATFGRTTLAGLAAGTLTAVAAARPAVSVEAPDGALVRPPATDLSRSVVPATPVANVDDRAVRGSVPPSRTPLAERLVAIREKIAP